MAEWRAFRGWTETELAHRLEALGDLRRNYDEDHATRMDDPRWSTHASRSVLGRVDPGPPDGEGPFARLREALRLYAFSDPDIVEAHFDREASLHGRRMLLELKVPGLRYLCGVVVGAVNDVGAADRSTFGFRYDTLEGHVERGTEWFVVEKEHASGEVRFRIEATWRPGDFPNAWSRVGFHLVGPFQQRRWHRKAHQRMAAFLRGAPLEAPGSAGGLTHQGPEVVFTRGGHSGPDVVREDEEARVP